MKTRFVIVRELGLVVVLVIESSAVSLVSFEDEEEDWEVVEAKPIAGTSKKKKK